MGISIHAHNNKETQRGQWQWWWWSGTGFSNSKTERFQEGHQKVCYFQLSTYFLMCVFLFFSQKLSSFLLFFLGTHFFLVCDYFSVWLQGNLRKINVERVKNSWILSHFDVLVSGNCNAWLIWAEIVVPNLVLEFSTLWVPFGTYKFCFLIPYFS